MCVGSFHSQTHLRGGAGVVSQQACRGETYVVDWPPKDLHWIVTRITQSPDALHTRH